MNSKTPTILTVLYRAALLLGIAIYLVMATILHSPPKIIVPAVILLGSIIALTYITTNPKLIIKNQIKKSSVAILGICTFLPRCLYVFFIDSKISQISDFELALDMAVSGNFEALSGYYKVYFHKFLYPYLLHALHMNTQTKVLYFQCICVSFVPIVLYLIGNKIGNGMIGFIAGTLYAIWPSQISYIAIVSEEHIASLLTTIIILLALETKERIDKSASFEIKHSIILLLFPLGMGLVCGLSTFFKDWGSVICVAIVICSVYLLFEYANRQRKLLFFSIALLIFGRGLVQTGITVYAEHVMNMKVSNEVIYIQMYESLNPESNGEYNAALNAEYMQLLEQNNYDFELTRKQAIEILKNRIISNESKMVKLISHKAYVSYGNDSVLIWWVTREMDPETYEETKNLINMISYIDEIFWMTMIIGILIALFTKNKYTYFVMLCIYGGMLVSLIIESQGRYKYSIQPLWTLPTAYVIFMLARSLSDRRKRLIIDPSAHPLS